MIDRVDYSKVKTVPGPEALSIHAALRLKRVIDAQIKNNRRVAFILPDGTISAELVGYPEE